jgi:hypothetical protein
LRHQRYAIQSLQLFTKQFLEWGFPEAQWAGKELGSNSPGSSTARLSFIAAEFAPTAQ